MRYIDLVEAPQTFYHGSNNPIDAFNLENVGRAEAVDQEGPGIYLTTSPEDARTYGKFVHILKVNVVKSRMMPEKRTFSYEFIRGLITRSPGYPDVVTDTWGENLNKGLHDATKVIMDSYGPNEYREALEQVWYDFWRGYEKEWLSRMRVLGWSGFLVPRSNGITHLICFDPSIIKIEGMLDIS